MNDTLLKIENLKTYYYTGQGTAKAVDGVSLRIPKGKTVALIGESGCGKTTVALSVTDIVDSPGKIAGGRIIFSGRDLLDLSEKDIRKVRGREISYIFQGSGSSLNPLLGVGYQIEEAALANIENISKNDAKGLAVDMLKAVHMPYAERVFSLYPHQLSGGMQQRIAIAMALICKPLLLIGDEPTTALDTDVKKQIIELLKELKEKYSLSVFLVAHDIKLVQELADYVYVMYLGQIVESCGKETFFKKPLSPYAISLLKCIPKAEKKGRDLFTIQGGLPDIMDIPSGCRFYPRCYLSGRECQETRPELIEAEEGHYVRCIKV